MSDAWRRLAASAVADHESNFFYEVDAVPIAGPGLAMRDLADGKPDCFPADQMAALSGRYGKEPVWVERPAATSEIEASDFYPHVARLIAGAYPGLLRSFSLAAPAVRLCGTADLYEEAIPAAERSRRHLEIRLSKAAGRRIEARGLSLRPLRVTLDRVALHVFATGKSFLVATIGVAGDGDGPLSPLELLEAQVALGRVHELLWAGDQPADSAQPFLLTSLLGRLALGGKATAPRGERLTTYTYLRLDRPIEPADADILAIHLARHYSTDYAVAETITGIEHVRAFETVRSVIANEGAATIVTPTPAQPELPAFLANFKTGTFRRHYLPIALLALHEQAFLIQRAARALDAPGSTATGVPLAELQRLLRDALLFRLRFRFAELSFISMHNEVNRGFRTVMSLDRLLDDLGNDVAAVEAFLRARSDAEREVAAEATERRFYWASVVGAMALAGLTTFTILKEAIEAFSPSGETGQRVAVIAGILVAAASLLVGLLRRPSHRASIHAHTEGEFAHHAMVEHMIHRAREPGRTPPEH